MAISLLLFCFWSFVGLVLSYPATQQQQQRPPSTFLGPDKQGCFWSRHNSESPILDKLECHLRTLTPEFWRGNVTSGGPSGSLTRDQLLRIKSLQLRCNDKLLFDSFLSPNQSLFAMSNVESVLIDGCKIRHLPGNVWATLSFLKTLVIRTRNGDWSSSSVSLELANEAFNGLAQLGELDLSDNNIWSVPDRLFCPLRSLTKLNISRNRLSELEEFNGSPEANYCMLNSVSSVDASWNGLRRIGRIVKWKKIQQLRLDNNFIEELDDGAFAELTQLKFVNLSSNRLVALPPTLFKYNSMLREVHLSNNTISALAPAVFSNLFGLLRLDMSRNTLTSQWIREKMFNGLEKLRVLNLSWNQLSYIDAGIFKDLVSLQSLSLGNNRIESVHPEAFVALTQLQVLDLTYNRLTVVDSMTFSSLVVIKRLYLDHNKIRTLPEDLLVNCTTLQDLGLADNILQEVPLALRIGLTSLETLDIGENRITSLSNDSFGGLQHLFGLRLVDNRLTELPRGFCDPLGKLRVLNVAQNRIQHVSSNAFSACKELRALRLDTNHLEELPSTLVPQLPSLLWLNVSENRLSSVDYSAIPRTVEWLDLSHNHLNVIRGLNDGPSVIPKLRVLDLAFNRLTHLDSTIIPASLETLQLSHNQLKTVASDTFVRSRGLRRVELIGNQLETLPLSAVRFPGVLPGRSLPELYLAGNPLNCDCTMEWLTKSRELAATTRNHPRIVDIDSLTCTSKMSANRTHVVAVRDAKSSDFMCTYTSHCFATCLCCDFEACDCQMSCPDNCTCYHDSEWTRNVVQCSAQAHTSVPSKIPMDATEIHLDGNHIPVLGAHVLLGKKNLRALYLNNSGVEEIKNKTFNSLRALQVLHLEDNRLSELRGHEFVEAESIRELYLQRNLIRAIAPSTFNVLRSLEVLKLDGNLLTELSVWELQLPPTFTTLSLADNPWSCQCSFAVQFRSWLFSHSSVMTSTSKAMLVQCYPDPSDLDQESHLLADSNEASRLVSPSKVHITTVCQPAQSSESMAELPEPDATLQVSVNVDQSLSSTESYGGSIQDGPELTTVTPSAQDQPLSGIYIGLLLCCVAFAIILFLMLFLFRREIREKFSDLKSAPALCCSSLRSSPQQSKKSSSSASTILTTIDGDKLFDAYFLYNRKDEDFLLDKVAPELESNPSAGFLRLCLHYRDLCLNPSNPWNAEMITSACDASKRVVLLLSANFLQTEWANNESRTAFHFVLTRPEVQRKLVLVLLPPVQEENLINFSPAIYPDASSPLSSLILGSSKSPGGLLHFNPSGPMTMTKTSTVHWSDPGFWSKFKLLLPPPQQLHPAVISGDHPMLIPATYTLSRAHHRTLNHQNQQTYSSIDGHTLNGSVGGPAYPSYTINYSNQQLQQQLPPPVPPVPGWPNMDHHRVHPTAQTLTPGHFLPFNESFKRHQQHSHHQQQPQSLRLSQHKTKKPHHHHHHNHHHASAGRLNAAGPVTNHCHQDSTCSNVSNNSRRPLQANSPAGYSSSVETNLSSSNEDLEHVYSTLDSPQPPVLHHHHHHHSSSGGGNGSNASDQQLLNPYSPCGSSNGGGNGGANSADPTMYFV